VILIIEVGTDFDDNYFVHRGPGLLCQTRQAPTNILLHLQEMLLLSSLLHRRQGEHRCHVDHMVQNDRFNGEILLLYFYDCSNCYPGSLNPKKVAGEIVVCVNNYPSISNKIKKLVVQDAGATGLIYISDVGKGVPFDSGAFPFTQVGQDAGIQIRKYINSTKYTLSFLLI